MNAYDAAAAEWVARTYHLDVAEISEVTFAGAGSNCDTCGYDAAGLSFRYGRQWRTEDFPFEMTAGRFIEECVQILERRDLAPGA